ncbi:Rhodanese-like domain-containing protein [Kockovaella imperatae]|uniref:Rhodanese-like domain-containing protein n=1 Tax=Kockovaella imperatae TaxID=4999 RepID=A0A1Y1UID7_9TREE|nr:Rhodanese-like domain-containing protein [Kockovaella imperatae]ORX37307.1 Rhodanese-like domain-containing protein [Kockovaella imperatae]
MVLLPRQSRLPACKGRAFSTSSYNQNSVPLLISPKQLKELPKNSTIPLDVSWHMPNNPRSALADYLAGPRIPNARRWDLDEVAELDPRKNPLSLTHMLPSKELFAEACGKRGISRDTHVVIYDTLGIFSSPRGLFTFKAFGHENVSVLDGGLPRWIAEGNDVELGDVPNHGEVEYTGATEPEPGFVRAYDEVVKNAQKPSSDPSSKPLLDHRPTPRWEGSAPEPRPGLPSGHIPNSRSTPFSSYLVPMSDKRPYTSYRPVEELRSVLVDGVGGTESWEKLKSGDGEIIFSCGSGMTAGIGWLAMEMVKHESGEQIRGSLYDESWTGYAVRPESAIATNKGSRASN